MARRRPGDQPLSEPRMVSLLTHLCVSLPQWVNGWHNWLHALVLHLTFPYTLRWRHNERDSVSNHQPHDCLLNGLFRRRLKKTSKLRVTGLCAGNSPGPVNSPHKGPVKRKMFPFDDVIIIWYVFILGGLCRYVYSRFVPSGVTISYSELTCVLWILLVFSGFLWQHFLKLKIGMPHSDFLSLVPGLIFSDTQHWSGIVTIFTNFPAGNFQAYFDNWWLMYLMWKCHWTLLMQVNVCSSMAWCHQASPSHNELNWVFLIIILLGPLLLTWMNFIPSMEKLLHPL